MDLYRDIILDHYKHPRNFGELDHAHATAEKANTSCGDVIRMQVKVTEKDGKKILEDIRFSGVGCAISQASASMLTEKVRNETLENVMKIEREDILELLGTQLTASRIKCALLPLEVLQSAAGSLQQEKK